LSDRTRKPLTILHVEPSSEAFQLPDGRVQRGVKITYDRESTERIRLGYACARCTEPFEEAWPERCPVCGAPIRARQSEYFEREFGGEIYMGSRIDLNEELDRLKHGEVEDQ
jgi:hypothetical protein